MAAIWWTSSTFGHCLFILPIVGWLIWQRREEIAPLTPQGWMPGLALFALGAFGWVIGEAAAVGLIRHASLIFMIQSAVLTILGPVVTRAILFPVFYLVFLVPFGEELVPPMQTITAKMCMILLDLVGIPAHIDGIFITISSGLFKVAEACSGVKFLVAMFAYGVLVTNVCYRSWTRRALFLSIAIIIPILANGLRAFGTIYISHLTDISFAASFDHVFYGWFFFAIVMALVMGVGWTFFDRKAGDPWVSTQPMRWTFMPAKPLVVGGVAFAIAALAMLWQGVIIPHGRTAMPHEIALPSVAGWQRVPIMQRYPWVPNFDNGDHYLFGSYANAKGQRVDLYIVLYGWQGEGREVMGFGQGAYDPESEWAWTNDSVSPLNGKAERIMAPGRISREVVSFFVLGGRTTGAARTVKLETLKSRLLGGDQSAVAILVSAENPDGETARPAIEAFIKDLGPVDQLATSTVRAARGS